MKVETSTWMPPKKSILSTSICTATLQKNCLKLYQSISLLTQLANQFQATAWEVWVLLLATLRTLINTNLFLSLPLYVAAQNHPMPQMLTMSIWDLLKPESLMILQNLSEISKIQKRDPSCMIKAPMTCLSLKISNFTSQNSCKLHMR